MTSHIAFFGAVAVRPPVAELMLQFEGATGSRVSAKWDLNPAVRSRIEAGALFDLTILNAELIPDLVALGRIKADSRAAFGRIGLGLAARAGASLPDIRTVDSFKRTLLAAKSIAYAGEGSSGAHFRSLLGDLGIAEQIGRRLKPVAGADTAASVGRGENELGVVPVSSILAAPGATLIGKFPEDLQSYVDFDLAIAGGAGNPEGARRLLDFLTSPALDAFLAARGIDRR